MTNNNEPVRCAQFSDSYLPLCDGVSLAVDAYAQWLNNMGDICYVVGPRYPKCADDTGDAVYRFRSIPVPGNAPYRLSVPWLGARFKRGVGARPLDIVHAHSPFAAGYAAMRLARSRGIPIVATFHSKYHDDFLQTVRLERIARGMTNRVAHFYSRADDVWTVNDATAQTLREYGYKGGVRVMPNGTDMEAPGDASDLRARAGAMLGIDDDTPLLLFVGRHEYKKNPHLLLEALPLLGAGARCHVAMAGDGLALEGLKALAARLSLGGRVTFLGHVGDREALGALYCRASLMVFPSVYDNAPLVLKEAAAHGCPALLIRGSNAADGVSDGHNGFLCEPDAASIARAIGAALANPEYAAQVGARARATLTRPWSDIVMRVREAYVDIIESYGKHSHK